MKLCVYLLQASQSGLSETEHAFDDREDMLDLAANGGLRVFDRDRSLVIFAGETLFQRRWACTNNVLDRFSVLVGQDCVIAFFDTGIAAVTMKIVFRSLHQGGNNGHIVHIGCR